MSACGSSSGFGFVSNTVDAGPKVLGDFTEQSGDSVGNLRSLITQSHLGLIALQRETEQEIIRVKQHRLCFSSTRTQSCVEKKTRVSKISLVLHVLQWTLQSR
ncbi:hypothetical protein MHYP_G00217870 [Metynnis hypsauchen]